MPSIEDSKCVLVTGATAGIGRALALAIADLPNKPKVIGTGRRQERLQEISTKCDTMALEMDTDGQTLAKAAADILANYPDLDTLVLNAGIQREVDFRKPESVSLDTLFTEMNVNYLSVVSMITAFLPHFLKRHEKGLPSFVVIVTSGLAILPGQWVPNYSASKAALHSLSMSLQAQFHESNVHVIEIIPPLVESELHDADGTTERLSRLWMPLDEFVQVSMEGLKNGASHIAAGTAKMAYEKYDRPKYDQIMEAAKRGRPQ